MNKLTQTNANKTMDQSNSVDVFYLAGVSYCGSTLLSFILNTHPEIFSIGEMGPYAPFEDESYECSCGSKLKECKFVLNVQKLMEKKYRVPFETTRWNLRHEVALGPFTKLMTRSPTGHSILSSTAPVLKLFSSKYQKTIQAYSTRNEAFIRSALEVSGKHVFFDATKSYRRIQLFHCNPDINLKVMHLIRDPRGYVYSAYKHSRKPADIAAREWVMENRFISNNLRLLSPRHVKLLKYETLCLEAEQTIKMLEAFIGVDSCSASTTRFGEKEHHIIGNDIRFLSGSLESVKLDEKWRKNLSSAGLRTVRAIAGKIAEKFGYDL